MTGFLKRLCNGFWLKKKKRVPLKYIKLIMDMHKKVVTSVRISEGITSVFPITISLY